MKQSQKYKRIPTELSEKDFRAFILPHLSKGSRGPSKKLAYYDYFRYIMRVLYTGMQWHSLEIKKGKDGIPEIHYTSIFKAFKMWVDDGSFEAIFTGTVMMLFRDKLVDCSVLHGDGTTQSAKKGGDTIGFNNHKKMKGDKTVSFCDRHVNVIAPFVADSGNRNEAIMLEPALFKLKKMADVVGLSLKGIKISLDSIYNSKSNRKKIFNRGMIPNINLRQCDVLRKGRNQQYDEAIFKERFRTIERLFAWEDKFKRVLLRFETISAHFYGFKLLVYSLINLRHFVTAS